MGRCARTPYKGRTRQQQWGIRRWPESLLLLVPRGRTVSSSVKLRRATSSGRPSRQDRISSTLAFRTAWSGTRGAGERLSWCRPGINSCPEQRERYSFLYLYQVCIVCRRNAER